MSEWTLHATRGTVSLTLRVALPLSTDEMTKLLEAVERYVQETEPNNIATYQNNAH